MGITAFVIKNQQGLYLNKQQEWVDGTDNHVLYRSRHRDEALNTVFEVSSRDIHLRAETVICELDAKGNPALATAETLTPARAAQLARQQNAELDDEPAPAEETPTEATEPSNEADAEGDQEPDAIVAPDTTPTQDAAEPIETTV
jgi:hypothetical protein